MDTELAHAKELLHRFMRRNFHYALLDHERALEAANSFWRAHGGEPLRTIVVVSPERLVELCHELPEGHRVYYGVLGQRPGTPADPHLLAHRELGKHLPSNSSLLRTLTHPFTLVFTAWLSEQLRNGPGAEVPRHIAELVDAGVVMSHVERDTLYVVTRPRERHYDEDGRPHRADGPALTWVEGQPEYWIHGRRITKELFQQVSRGRFHPGYWFELDEGRREWLHDLIPHEQWTADPLHRGAKGTTLHSFRAYGKTYFYLSMVCPSTGRRHYERVSPAIGRKKDADLAQAFAFGITKDQYLDMMTET
jgi:hypothetical protein